MTNIDRLKTIINEKFNGNQADFARAIKKAPAQVNQWLNGYRNIGNSAALDIENALNLPIGWINGSYKKSNKQESNFSYLGTIDPWDSKTPLNDDDVEVPFYKDILLSAGNGLSDDLADYNDLKLRFSRSALRRYGVNPKDVSCVTADGNSMEPVIPDGTTIGINAADKIIKDGKIYAMNHGGLLRTKILKKKPDNRLLIQSYNKEEYPDEEVSMEDVVIIGRVFWWSVIS